MAAAVNKFPGQILNREGAKSNLPPVPSTRPSPAAVGIRPAGFILRPDILFFRAAFRP